MATGSNKDVNLTLRVGTLGAENIEKLQTSLRDLAQEGGEGAAEFAKMADEIAALGDQGSAIDALQQLGDKSEQLGQRQRDLVGVIDSLKEKLDEKRTALEQSRRSEEQVAQSILAHKLQLEDLRLAQKRAKEDSDGLGKTTEAYATSLKASQQALVSAKKELIVFNDEQARAKGETAKLASEAKALENTLKGQEKSLTGVNKALGDNATSMATAADAARQLGVNTEDLAQSSADMYATIAKAKSVLAEHAASTAAAAEAERELDEQSRKVAAALKDRNAAVAEKYRQDQIAAAETEKLARAEREAAEAAAREEAAARSLAAAKAEQAEADRQALTIQASMAAARARAVQELQAEQEAYAESIAFVKKYEQAQQDAMAAIKRAAEEAAGAAAQAATDLSNAFGKIDTRSIKDVQREIDEVRQAMALVKNSGEVTGNALNIAFERGGARIKQLEREIRELNGTLTTADKASKLLSNSMGQIAAGNLVADAIGWLVEKVKELGRQFIVVIAQTESFRRALNAIYKDAGTTARQFEFLRSAAMSAGVSVGDLQSQFVKYSAATHAANIPLKTSNDLFYSVARAAGTLGLSGEQVSGILEALGQMASKGTVSMEELRQQLGDRLPGAMGLLAKGLGISTAQLIKLVESGQLAAQDVFPAMAKSLKPLHGEVDGLNTTWSNFKNVLNGVAQDAGDAGWVLVLTAALKILAALVGTLALGLSTLWEGLRLVAVGMAAFAANITSPSKALEIMNEEVDASIDRLTKQDLRLKAMLDPTSEAAKQLKSMAEAQKQVASNAEKVSTFTATQNQVVAESAAGMKFASDAAAILGNSTMDAAAKIVKLNVAAGEMIPKLEASAVAADKSAKAVKIEGDAAIALAELRGEELGILEARLEASEKNSAASLKSAEAQRAIVEVLETQRNAVIALAEQEANGLEGRKDQIEAIDKKIEKAKAESEQVEASAKALEQEIFQRKLAVDAAKDNSAAVVQLRDAMLTAVGVELKVAQALKEGKATQEQYNKAKRDAISATNLYRDALKDTVGLISASAAVQKGELEVTMAGIRQKQNVLKVEADIYRQRGQSYLAMLKEIEAKELDIQLAKLTAEMKRIEAQAIIAQVAAEREELTLKGELTKAKELEMQARLQNARIKEIEASGSDAVVRGIELEIQKIREHNDAKDGSARASDRDSAAARGNADAHRDAAAALREEAEAAKAADAAKWGKNTAGGTVNGKSDFGTQLGIVNFLKNAGLDEKKAWALSEEFVDSKGNVQVMNNPGQIKYGAYAGDSMSGALMNAASQILRQQSKGGSMGGTGSDSKGDTTGKSTSHQVTVNVNGKKKTINTASAGDSESLVDVLRSLEQQAGVSS